MGIEGSQGSTEMGDGATARELIGPPQDVLPAAQHDDNQGNGKPTGEGSKVDKDKVDDAKSTTEGTGEMGKRGWTGGSGKN
jgi:hypothetical protein